MAVQVREKTIEEIEDKLSEMNTALNKIDYMEFSDFNLEKMRERVLRLNPDIEIIPVSCRTGAGIENWLDWLRLVSGQSSVITLPTAD